ncbi:ABC transporter substrate-binding protein [Chitinimonas koreensis]|uniref:ABC transporter substrate-binding protein n=1 Tax=Chitinimonas koreensis TaxID=356302 RepID=UPI0004279146|nr:ABC transporter substrate-binding protein [Chitinimonas koreensis]QNM97951.1 carbohydrate ABC transporter substrate-binding protein [Chitinimonas koreensis]
MHGHLKQALALSATLALACWAGPAHADDDAVMERLLKEFSPSTLGRDAQRREFEWFRKAARPFKGKRIMVVSETIDTHVYEADVIAKAFTELTGIEVVQEITGEDDVVKKIETQVRTGLHLYDAYVSDSDLIGWHYRSGKVVNLTDFMAREGRSVTSPTLDLNDFIGRSFSTGPDGKLYQLPDQQFANLYWYRKDWFDRPDLQKRFKELYGYALDVPVNWSAYEDIAEFFTVHVKELDGKRIYGHMDYGRMDPSLGWRFSDAWFSMAGAGDKGLPNGKPVDDWGIRVDGCAPVGASVARGGDMNGPAAVYSVNKFIDWLNKYAPPEARRMDFNQAGAVAGQGHIAQQIFWYTAFTAAMTRPGLPVNNTDGTPKWRMAPSPHGSYWRAGTKLGYQDAGAWTLVKGTPPDNLKAAWLYAQFTVSKAVSLKKTLVGLTPIRESDIESQAMTEAAPRLGGLVEFYRSPARRAWTPTGTNVPDYPNMAPIWWSNIGAAIKGEVPVQTALDTMAQQADDIMLQLQRRGMAKCAPRLNPLGTAAQWQGRGGAPYPRLADEKPKGETLSYEESLKQSW